MTNARILFVLQTPPPIHGASLMGSYIQNSELINSTNKTSYINMALSSSPGNIGRKSPRKVIRYIQIISRIRNQLYSFRPDLVYFTPSAKGLGFYKDFFLIYLVKMLGHTVVLHFHNKGVSLKTDAPHKFLYKLMFKDVKVILLSNRLYYDISQYINKEYVYACPNGIPDVNTQSRIPNYLNMEFRPLKLLFLSNITRSKGVETLFDALEVLMRRGVSFECEVVGPAGDLSLVDLVKITKEKELTGLVRILGKKYGNDKIDVLANADILIHPTLDDCFPLVLLEALMFGIPVITTKEGAIEDIIKDGYNGFLVEKRNPTEIANAVEILAVNKKLVHEMSSNALASYKENFTLDHFESSLNKILQS